MEIDSCRNYGKHSIGLLRMIWTVNQNWPFTVETTIADSLMIEWDHPPIVWHGDRQAPISMRFSACLCPFASGRSCGHSGKCTMCRDTVSHLQAEACLLVLLSENQFIKFLCLHIFFKCVFLKNFWLSFEIWQSVKKISLPNGLGKGK